MGIWYDRNVSRATSDKPQSTSISWMQKSLKAWGYNASETGKEDTETQKTVAAFQMHFRPECYDGKTDEESMDILDALLCAERSFKP